MNSETRNAPGSIRDAIVRVLSLHADPMPVRTIDAHVQSLVGPVPSSSIRSYLRLNTPQVFIREGRGLYRLNKNKEELPYQLEADFEGSNSRNDFETFSFGASQLVFGDCIDWLSQRPTASLHAVVTDPPYGLVEYSESEQEKLRNGKGGVWRIPPAFDGNQRSPLPRFTTLTESQLQHLYDFFLIWGREVARALVPGANVLVASNPLVSFVVSNALREAGLERRGEIVRLISTMRGGDRPKAAHDEFAEVSVMPRSMWEPWLVFRKPIEGRVQDNLRKWSTGGFRRPERDRPFGDVIKSSPARGKERQIGNHPSLKPQSFLREVVRAVLPLGEGIVLDPFAGSGSTLAAAEAVGYRSIGIEKDRDYFELAINAIAELVAL